MNTEYKLPSGVAESWFLMTASGEVYDSQICRGDEIVRVWAEMCFGKLEDAQPDVLAKWTAHVADEDNWWTRDGVCTGIEDQMEDGAITFHLIRNFAARVDVERKLIAVARAAHTAMDNSQEVEFEDARGHVIDGSDFDDLSNAMDALDDLREMTPPNVGTGPAKAEHALGLNR